MVLAIGNGLGRLILPTVSDAIGCFHSWKILSAAAFINMLAFPFYTSHEGMMFGVFVLGVFYGACVPLTWASIAAVFGKKYLGSIYGYITVSFGIAAFIAPMVVAMAFDMTGSFKGALIAVALCQLVGFALAFTVKDKPVKALELAARAQTQGAR